MLAAALLMCALSARECRSDDARAIATAIDSATDSDELRAALVTYAWYESRWQLHPRAESWDALAGLATGPWQLWGSAGHLDLDGQARAWLRNVEHAGLASVDSSPARASHRAAVAEKLVSKARLQLHQLGL